MRNRSSDMLPVFFIQQETFPFSRERKLRRAPLEIYDFTFLHFHDFLEIGYCLEGEGICRVGDTEYPFKKGDIQVILPFQKHLSKNKNDKKSRWYWLNINPYALMERAGFGTVSKIEQLLFQEMGLCGIFSPAKYPEIASISNQLLQEVLECGTSTLHHLESCATYVYQLLIQLSRLSENLPKLEMERDRNVTILAPALILISDGIQQSSIPSVNALASACGMSVSNFRKVWRRVIGFSPKDYIIKSFLYKAEQLLISTDKTITEISMLTGFENVSGFNRQFRQKNNMSPSEFRKRYKKKRQ